VVRNFGGRNRGLAPGNKNKCLESKSVLSVYSRRAVTYFCDEARASQPFERIPERRAIVPDIELDQGLVDIE
jgi:hypothetical protein